MKKLFRKVDNKSSSYDSEHSGRVRRDGSYIYEEFLPTGGTDVKVGAQLKDVVQRGCLACLTAHASTALHPARSADGQRP